MTHLPPLDPATWPDALEPLRDGFAGRLNVYKVMAHHPALLAAWAGLRAHVVTQNALGPELMEVAILRIAVRLGSPYEWAHHVVRAAETGLSADRIAQVAGDADGMAREDAAVARGVDELIDATRLTPETLDALRTLVGTEGVFDLMATVGFYKTLGCIAATFEVPLDAGIPRASLP